MWDQKLETFDPDVNPVYQAFAEHWGFTPLPTKPRNPKENGKQERSRGYVNSNALKAKRFDSLRELNDYLKKWNRTIARLRIHSTTCKQVWTHFLEAARVVREHANALLVGPPGVGKSHAAIAIGVGAIRSGYRVLMRSVFDVVQDFAEADATGERRELVNKLARIDLRHT